MDHGGRIPRVVREGLYARDLRPGDPCLRFGTDVDMRPVRTHTFNGEKYTVDHLTEIGGLCDIEAKSLVILRGNNINALGSALEEGLHALGIPDRYLHKSDSKVPIGKSLSKVDDLARFLWRLGYRLEK